MVNLVDQGHADQNDVARAFCCSARTVRRGQERFAQGGLAALARTVGYPKGRRRLPQTRDRLVSRLKTEGWSNYEIARRVGVNEKAIRKQLKRLGWREQAPEQPVLALTRGTDPNLSAFVDVPVENTPTPAPPTTDPNLSASDKMLSLDHDPGNRAMDRLLARAGLIDDAIPLFRRTMRGFKIAASAGGRAIAAAERRVAQLERRRSRLPHRVPVSQVVDGQVVRLATERKHLTNCLKMVAYQAEGELVGLVGKHYRRAEDEGRTLVQTALASAADLIVTKTELRVVLAPLSSQHRSKAVAALCAELNAGATVFPGTKLRLRYSVAAGV